MRPMRRSDFGPNTWLVEQMYREYVTDPSSVSEAWREFFEDYRPDGETGPAVAERPPAEPERRPEEEPRREEPREPPEGAEPLRGSPKVIAERMEESLGVPTATSFRTIPAKLLEVNREILNRHLQRQRGGKVSFTHLIGFAVVRAAAEQPAMNVSFAAADGVPHVVRHEHVNLGLAVDVQREDGSRTLLVPNIKEAETLPFDRFFRAYEDLIQTGFTTISFDLDQQADPTLHVDQLERFMQVARGRAVAIGNVDATVFEKTTKERMEAEVRRCIDTAARQSAFVLSTSCEIPPRSDPEAVQWFMDAAREYGRYERIFEATEA